jgi:glycosyltransferase involved in cell wall biosynthesis
VKLAVISDSPTLTTGFAMSTDALARAFAAAGHEVVCFGIKAYGETFDRADYPFRIWTVSIDPGTSWAELLRRFLAYERPDVIFINMDIFNLKEVLGYCASASWSAPLVVLLILDGIPAYAEYLAPIHGCAQILVTTQAAAKYLRSCGAQRLRCAPPGVDPEIFHPLPDRSVLRQQAGLAGKFLVGCFGRNAERKQQHRLLQALSLLDRAGEADDVHLYFHCTPRAYWHLDELAADLGVADRVHFATAGGVFDEAQGIPYLAHDGEALAPPGSPRIPDGYSYVQRMSCCDLIVNPSHCGDFEQVLVQAQACGVPLAATDDRGIMAEALGEGGVLLPAVDVGRGRVGQRIYLVDVREIAGVIRTLKGDPAYAAELRARGLAKARNHRWSLLATAALDAVEEARRG